VHCTSSSSINRSRCWPWERWEWGTTYLERGKRRWKEQEGGVCERKGLSQKGRMGKKATTKLVLVTTNIRIPQLIIIIYAYHY
jgi:hypothetical protein